MFYVKTNESDVTRRRVGILLVDATDGFTPETGVTSPTITLSKNGASGIGATGTFSEVGNGIYSYQFTTGEIDTLGWVSINVRKAGVTRDYNAIVQVSAVDNFDPVNFGLSSLPEAAIGSTGALLTSYTSNGAIDVTATGAIGEVSTIVQPVEITAGSGTSVAYDVWNFDISGIGATNTAGGQLNVAAVPSGGTGSSAEFAMAVWDYDLSSYTSATGVAGERLQNNGNYVWTVDVDSLAQDIWQPNTKLINTVNSVYDPNIPGQIIGQNVWTYNTGTGNSAAEQLNLAAAGGVGVSYTQIADAVWSTDPTSYSNPAAGNYLTNIDTNAQSAANDALTAAFNTGDIGGTVWGTDISAYTSPSAGYELLNAGAGSGSSSAVEIAAEVWGYSPDRTITGGTGVTLATALPSNFSSLSINGSGEVTTSNPGTGSTATVQQIAEAVWLETVVGVGDTNSAAVYLTNTLFTAGNIETYVQNQTPQDIWTYAGVEGRTITGGVGVTISQAFPANFADLAITASTGLVTTSNPGTGSTATPQEVAQAIWDYDITGYYNDDLAGTRLFKAPKYIWEVDLTTLSIGDYWQAGNKLSTIYSSVYDPGIPGIIIGDNVWAYNTGTGNSAAEQLNLAAAGTSGSSSVEIAGEVWSYVTREITGGIIDTNNDKTGYDLNQTFPSNFSDLAITASTGLVTTSNPGTGSTATPQDVASAVWEADPAYHNNNSTFGKAILRSDNANITGLVTMWSGASYNGVMADAYRIDESYDAAINLKNVLTGIGSTVTGNIVGSIDTVVNDVNISASSVDSIWTEDVSGYTSPSAGYDLANAGTSSSSAIDIANEVWAYNISTGPASPSASYYINNIDTSATSAAADASTAASNTTDIGGTVWSTDISGYTSPSAGYELVTAGAGSGGSSASEIAEAVWLYNTGTGASAGAQLNAAAVSTGSTSDTAAAVWSYVNRHITSGVGVTLAPGQTPSGFTTLSISGGKVSIVASDITAIQSGLSTLTAAQVGSEVDASLSDVGLTTTVTGRIDATVSSRLASASAPANFNLLSINGSGQVTTSNPGTGSTASPADIAAATWGYGSGRTITGGIGVTLATGLPSNFSSLDIDGSGKVSVQSGDITAIQSGLSTLTAAQVGTEVDSSLSDVGLTTTVTGRIDADISSRLAASSAPANFGDMSITETTGYVSIGQTVPSAAAISTAVWTTSRASIGPSSGQFGYFLDARVSQAGGGAVTTVQLGPFDLRASDSVNGYLDALVDDERTIAVAITDDNGNPIPLDSANTHNVLVYDANSTLVATYAATVEYEAGGAASFFLDTDVSGTAGTYKCIFDIDNGSYISKYGGLTILVKLC